MNNLAGEVDIRLTLDEINISDSTIFGFNNWELHDITLTGIIKNINSGNHIIKIYACVDGGFLNIPHYNTHYNTHCIENTIYPSIFANMYVIGYPK